MIFRSFALVKLGRNEESLSAYEKAIELDPKSADVYYERACFYSIRGDKDSFFRDLKKSIDLDQELKKSARKNDDFKNFWDDDEFKRIVK